MLTTTNGTVTIPVERYDELKRLYDSFQEGGIILKYKNKEIRVITKDDYVNELTVENTELKESAEKDSYYQGFLSLREILWHDNINFFNAYFKIKKIKKIFCL